MKRILLSLVGVCSFFVAFSKVFTVSNNAASPGQYSLITDAIAASSPGDTLYIQGSPTTYGNFTLNKKLTLIGAGYAPDSTDYAISSTIGSITLDSLFNTPVSGSKFIGLYIDGYVTYASSKRGYFKDITFEKCLFNSTVYISGNNWLFLNCYIDYTLDMGYYDNIIVANSFFFSSYINYSNKASVNIYNSIFLNTTGDLFYAVTNLNVYNSIFWNNTIKGCSNCVFTNNISFFNGDVTLPGAGNLGSNNISNQDPQFVSGITFSNTINNLSDVKKYDWHLKSSSPGYKAGTDGNDMGMYGGSYPFVNLSGMYAKIPLIKSFLIKNPVVQKNGTLQISINAVTK